MEYTNESDDLEKELIQLLYSSPDPPTMLREIAQKCGEGLRVNTCVIIADIEVLENAQIGFWHQAQMAHTIIKQLLSRSEINEILNSEQPLELNNLSDLLSVQTILGVKTEFQGRANGLILLGKNASRTWTPDEQDRLLQIQKTVAIACTIVQSQKENQSSERGIDNTLSLISFSRGAYIPDIIRRLYDFTRQQLEQQRHLLEQERQLNEKKNEIIAAISDKARNPLASMNMAIQLLSDPNRQLPPQMQENYWNILKQEWTNLNDLITSIVTLDQIESKDITLQFQSVNLISIIQTIASTFREQWSQNRRKLLNLEVDCPSSPIQFYTDIQHLENILKELLTNAGHFSVPEQTVVIKIEPALLEEQPAIKITIINTGDGIPLEEQELIYQPFYRGKKIIEKGIPGTGLGLAVVAGLVELLGGKLEMTSELIENSDRYITSFSVIFLLNPNHNTN